MSDIPEDPDRAPADEAAPGTPDTAEDLCPTCGGSGRVDDGSCPDCRGTGRVTEAVGGG
jgi:DnaJ-class molecular chaperone